MQVKYIRTLDRQGTYASNSYAEATLPRHRHRHRLGCRDLLGVLLPVGAVSGILVPSSLKKEENVPIRWLVFFKRDDGRRMIGREWTRVKDEMLF